jgi:hypothetical protein
MIPMLWIEPYNEQILTKNNQVSVQNNLDGGLQGDFSVERLEFLFPIDMSQVRTLVRIPHIARMFVILQSYIMRML